MILDFLCDFERFFYKTNFASPVNSEPNFFFIKNPPQFDLISTFWNYTENARKKLPPLYRYLEKMIIEGKRNGLNLPEEEREKVRTGILCHVIRSAVTSFNQLICFTCYVTRSAVFITCDVIRTYAMSLDQLFFLPVMSLE